MNGQPGIYVAPTQWALFLEFDVHEPAALAAELAALSTPSTPSTLPALPTPSVVAFSGALWQSLGAEPKVHSPSFEPLQGPEFQAPASQTDLLVWYRDNDYGQLFDLGRQAVAGLTCATLRTHAECFDYHGSRDLTGFEDGTGNPKGDRIAAAAEIPEGQPGAGGSFVLGQKWRHNLDAFAELSVTDQQNVIGRTKADSVELVGDAMPPDSHVSRTDLEIDGVAQKIYRRSMPYGDLGDHGLYFFAFACDYARFDTLLASMFDTHNTGIRDRLLDYSTPISGSYWFAPAEQDLARLYWRPI